MRRRGRNYFYRVRIGRTERTINLGRDYDVAVRKYLDLRKKRHERPGAEVLTPTLTVKEAAKQWLEEHVQHNRTAQNHRDAEARSRMYLEEFMGGTRIDLVTAATLSAYRHWLAGRLHPKTKQPLAAITVKHILADCRAMLNFSLNTGLIERSPVPTRGWIPKIPQHAPDRFTPEERECLVHLPDPIGWILRFLIATGLRWGEMVRAQVSDITDGVLLVRKSKSGKVRRVPIPGGILEETRNRVGRLCPFDFSGNFNTQVRRLIAEHIKTLDEERRKPLERLSRFHVHLTRHTFASEWREAGGSLSALQKILGHSTIRTTEQYGEIADDVVIAEARRIERVKNGTKNGTKAGEGTTGLRSRAGKQVRMGRVVKVGGGTGI